MASFRHTGSWKPAGFLMTLRGLVSSLGAGGSLIAAAVCALAVFGGVLAFRGEDPGTAEARGGDVVMRGRPAWAQPRSSSPARVVAAPARTRRDGRAAVAERPRRAGARRPRTSTRRTA